MYVAFSVSTTSWFNTVVLLLHILEVIVFGLPVGMHAYDLTYMYEKCNVELLSTSTSTMLQFDQVLEALSSTLEKVLKALLKIKHKH